VHRALSRALAFGSFVAAAAVAVGLVVSALGREAPTAGAAAAAAKGESFTVALGAVRVGRSTKPSGEVCYQVNRAGVRLATSCVRRLGDGEISYVLARRRTGQLVLAGVAGPEVRAVSAQLRPGVKLAATLRDGAFAVPLPARGSVRAVTKTLDDGTTRTFAVARG
jgi:hypothetical protein